MSGTTGASVGIRLALEGAQVVQSQMDAVGASGQRMAHALESAASGDVLGALPSQLQQAQRDLVTTAEAAQRMAAELAGTVAPSAAAGDAGMRFVAALREQLVTLSLGETELLRYQAAQHGVLAESDGLIRQLALSRAATQDRARADAQAAQEASQLQSAQKRFVAALQEQVATQDLAGAALLRYKASQLGVSEQVEPLIQRLHASNTAMGSSALSAGELTQAMRMLPMQMTDVVTSLASGMPPFMVLIQQGGQLKDAFGGVGPALRAVGGWMANLLTPGAAVAAVVALMGLAAYQAAARHEELARALYLSGNAAGVTTGQMAAMAASISQQTGLVESAVESAIGQLVSAGAVAEAQMGAAAEAAVRLERVGGQAVEKTAQQFADLGRDPVGAALRLNDSFSFLTASTVRQIQTAVDLGDKHRAAQIAQDAYAEAIKTAAAQTEQELGLLSRTIKSVTDSAGQMWSALTSPGKTAAAKELDDLKQLAEQGYRLTDADKARLAELESSAQATRQAAEQAAAARKREADQARAVADWNKSMQGVAAQYLTAKERELRLEQQIARIRAEGAAAGASQDQIDARIKAVKAQAVQASGDAGAQGAAVEAARIQAAEALRQDAYRRTAQVLQATRQMGRLSDEAYLAAKLGNDRAELDSQAQKITAELELARRRQKSGADQVTLNGRLAAIESQRATAQLTYELELAALEDRRSRQAADDRAATVDGAQREAAALEEQVRAQQDANAVIGLTGQALANVTAQRLLDAAAQKESRAKALEELDADLSGEYLRQAAALRELADQKRAAASTQATQDAAGRLGVKLGAPATADAPDMGVMRAALEAMRSPLATLAGQYADLMTLQADWGRQGADIAKRMAGTDEQRAQAVKDLHLLQARQAAGSVAAYATMTGAAKGMFREGSAGYKALEASERGFRLLQLAQSAGVVPKLISDWMGLTAAKVAGDQTMAASGAASAAADAASSTVSGTAAAAAGVAKQASAGDPYTAFARMAAMAAAMAALGFVTGGVGGGGSASDPGNTGTGTVLGDSTAQSESLSGALDSLADVDTMTMRYSADMAASLRSIDASMAGLASMLSVSSAMTLEGMGIKVGFEQDAIGNLLGDALGSMGGLGQLLPGMVGDLVGGLTNAIGSVVGGLFGSKTSVTGQGLYVGGTTMGDIAASGVNAAYYADVSTTKKAFGISYGTSTSTQYQAASDDINRQLSLVMSGIGDTLTSSAGALSSQLGVSLDDVRARMAAATVDIGKINLKDLNGSEIQDKLAAVFSAAADRVAEQSIPGLEAFQAVGEGYYETVTRVAVATESAQVALSGIGVAMISVTDLADKQADVAAELVRESIAAKEGLSGVGQIIAAMDADVSDLTAAYTALVGIRYTLAGIGTTATDVTTDLLAGAGGLQSLQDSLSSYTESFLTAEEQLYLERQSLSRQFEAIGFDLPATASAYRQLVQGIDASTASGQALLGQVLSLSGGMSDLLDATDTWRASIADASQTLRDAVDSARYGDMTTKQQLGTLRAEYAAAVQQSKRGTTDDRTAAAATMAELLPKILEAAREVGSVDYLALRDKLTSQADAVTTALDALAAGGGASSANAAAATATAALATATAVQQASATAGSAADMAAGAGMMQLFTELIAQIKALRRSVEAQGASADVVASVERLGRAVTGAIADLGVDAVGGLDDVAKASAAAGRAVVSALEATR